MWWEYAITGGAVLLAVLWLARRFTTTSSGACDGCGGGKKPSGLQTRIPDFRSR